MSVLSIVFGLGLIGGFLFLLIYSFKKGISFEHLVVEKTDVVFKVLAGVSTITEVISLTFIGMASGRMDMFGAVSRYGVFGLFEILSSILFIGAFSLAMEKAKEDGKITILEWIKTAWKTLPWFILSFLFTSIICFFYVESLNLVEIRMSGSSGFFKFIPIFNIQVITDRSLFSPEYLELQAGRIEYSAIMMIYSTTIINIFSAIFIYKKIGPLDKSKHKKEDKNSKVDTKVETKVDTKKEEMKPKQEAKQENKIENKEEVKQELKQEVKQENKTEAKVVIDPTTKIVEACVNFLAIDQLALKDFIYEYTGFNPLTGQLVTHTENTHPNVKAKLITPDEALKELVEDLMGDHRRGIIFLNNTYNEICSTLSKVPLIKTNFNKYLDEYNHSKSQNAKISLKGAQEDLSKLLKKAEELVKAMNSSRDAFRQELISYNIKDINSSFKDAKTVQLEKEITELSNIQRTQFLTL
jgi:hypothetical protein